ncbi:Probable calcium-binding protein CML27 [Striga hermonthica]|uniref:Probable calcium-binding protein CML27 n=1 Tax=Striga hermonthica TaxID=68872 RepID=A0A9N7NXT1_STRHE|nr:Probable calcium-binding protein CML27 [Striga hermonthica]
MAENPAAIQLTVEEEVERIFRKFDSNGDGRISLTELGAILNGLGSETPPDEVARIMSELDTDGDGFIDLKEFKAFHCGGAGDGVEADNKQLKEAFDLYDQDKNGKISANELHAVLRSLGEKCSLRDCRQMISNVDADGDGCVNFKEFKKMMTRSST